MRRGACGRITCQLPISFGQRGVYDNEGGRGGVHVVGGGKGGYMW